MVSLTIVAQTKNRKRDLRENSVLVARTWLIGDDSVDNSQYSRK